MKLARLLWNAANSSVGVVLLSSVIIAGMGRLYTDYTAEKKERSQREERLSELTAEIRLRKDRLTHELLVYSVAVSHSNTDPYIYDPFPASCLKEWISGVPADKVRRAKATASKDADRSLQFIRAAVHGVEPYIASREVFRGQHLAALIQDADRAAGDQLGSVRIGLPDSVLFDKRRLPEASGAFAAASGITAISNPCLMWEYAEAVVRYENARSYYSSCEIRKDEEHTADCRVTSTR